MRFTKSLTSLIPCEDSMDDFKKLKHGEVYHVDVKHQRNAQFHAKYFALLKLGWSNTQMDLPFEVYRKWVIMNAGFVDIYETKKGKLYEAKSIKFSKMTPDEFKELYERSIDVIIADIGCEREDIIGEVMNFT